MVREGLLEEAASELRPKGFQGRSACVHTLTAVCCRLSPSGRPPDSEGSGKAKVTVEGRPGFLPLEKNLRKLSLEGSGDRTPATYKQARRS